MRTVLVSALADNPIGRLIDDLIYQGGVDHAHLAWRPHDGVGRSVRNGLNFTERGFGVRGPLGCSDRGHTAAASLAPGEVDWRRIFGIDGARWFHCGGIYSALSETTAQVAAEAMATARRNDTVVSYDLNYGPLLWSAIGGKASAAEVNQALIRQVDVLLGNEEDFSATLGFKLEGVNESFLELDFNAYRRLLEAVLKACPQLAVVATTLRQLRSATVNDWTAVCVTRDAGFLVGPRLDGLDILDRVGGGDSFASGLFYSLLTGRDSADALAYGVAHGALAMTTPGDISMATLEKVERLVHGAAPRVAR